MWVSNQLKFGNQEFNESIFTVILIFKLCILVLINEDTPHLDCCVKLFIFQLKLNWHYYTRSRFRTKAFIHWRIHWASHGPRKRLFHDRSKCSLEMSPINNDSNYSWIMSSLSGKKSKMKDKMTSEIKSALRNQAGRREGVKGMAFGAEQTWVQILTPHAELVTWRITDWEPVCPQRNSEHLRARLLEGLTEWWTWRPHSAVTSPVTIT